MIIYEIGFRVGVWVCEWVSNPTRKLVWLIKLEVGYKMHALGYDSKRNEKNYFLKRFMGHVVIYPAYCILHVGTLLSFPKLIPSLIICRYALRRWTRRWALDFMTYLLLRAISCYCHLVQFNYVIQEYWDSLLLMHHYFVPRYTYLPYVR